MRLIMKTHASDVQAVKDVCIEMKANAFVQRRLRRNVHRKDRPKLTRATVWHAHVSCLLTTQQRSGPGSRVQQVITAKPFPIALARCRAQKNVARFVSGALSRAGVRRSDGIGRQAAANLRFLEEGSWAELMERLASLEARRGKDAERAVARWVDENLAGFGPKQSRNLLQMLGLTLYEIPIDSRIGGWLREHGFPIPLTPAALGDLQYYEFVLDRVQELCEKAEVYPCVFDAAVFASYDGGRWEDAKIVW